MIFKTVDGYESNHVSLNGMIDLLVEGQCECDDEYYFNVDGVKHEYENENLCRYCYMEKYLDQLSVDEKVNFIQDCSYEVINRSQLEDYGYEEDEVNELGEHYFGHTCDECGGSNVQLIEGKYYLCDVCKDKR